MQKIKDKIHYFFKYHFLAKTRRFIKETFNKYVRWYGFWTEERLRNRKTKQNRRFKWSEKNIQKVNELNAFLSDLMEQIYADCSSMKSQFDEWISEGKGIYRNYIIKGSIVYCNPEEESCSKRKLHFIEAQDAAVNSREWCVTFADSSSYKTEIKKQDQMNNFRSWESDFVSTLKEKGIENPCAYLDVFLGENNGYSLKDFVKMDKKDFCKHVEVSYEHL